jgi:hypothetical protein
MPVYPGAQHVPPNRLSETSANVMSQVRMLSAWRRLGANENKILVAARITGTSYS